MSDEGISSTFAVVRNGDGWTITGEIDAHSAPSLAAALGDMPDATRVVADFAGVTFMDSSGLRVLLDAALQATAAGKTFAIAHPQAAIRRVVEISGLTEHLHFLD
jgi:anti-anti-sigma factor